jgi:hypothetical protein
MALGPGVRPRFFGGSFGSLKAGLLLESRVWEADDEGHGKTRAAPAHHRRAPATGVFPLIDSAP